MSSPLSILEYQRPVEFKIGDTLVRTWNVLSRHFVVFAVMVAILHLPSLVLSYYAVTSPPSPSRFNWLALASWFANQVLSELASAIVIVAAYQEVRGQPVDPVGSVRQGLGRLIAVFFASITTGLCIVL